MKIQAAGNPRKGNKLLLSETKSRSKSAHAFGIPEGAVLLVRLEGNQSLLEKKGLKLVESIRNRKPARKGQKTAMDYLKDSRDGR